jgi:hypothetical protein
MKLFLKKVIYYFCCAGFWTGKLLFNIPTTIIMWIILLVFWTSYFFYEKLKFTRPVTEFLIQISIPPAACEGAEDVSQLWYIAMFFSNFVESFDLLRYMLDQSYKNSTGPMDMIKVFVNDYLDWYTREKERHAEWKKDEKNRKEQDLQREKDYEEFQSKINAEITEAMKKLLQKVPFETTDEIDEVKLFLAIRGIDMRIGRIISFLGPNFQKMELKPDNTLLFNDTESVPEKDLLMEVSEMVLIKSEEDCRKIMSWIYQAARQMPDLFRNGTCEMKEDRLYVREEYRPDDYYKSWN